jgi:hypothetical protein
MGLLHDALALGYITMDEYEEMKEDWSGWGTDASLYGDTAAFQDMAQDLSSRGITDLADEAWDQVENSAYYYAMESGFEIFYDTGTGRWRWESGTEKGGQFTFDPYEQIRF